VTSFLNRPWEFILLQSCPNPFDPTTMVRYQLPADSRITPDIYNVLGLLVTTLVGEIQAAGYKQVEWNAGSIASGACFFRLEATPVPDPSEHLHPGEKDDPIEGKCQGEVLMFLFYERLELR